METAKHEKKPKNQKDNFLLLLLFGQHFTQPMRETLSRFAEGTDSANARLS